MKKKIVYLIGTRPEIIRSSEIILALKKDPGVFFKLVHTGQHYDYLMDKVFLKELNLPRPDINLKVRSGTHAEETAKIMLRFEKWLLDFKPDLVAVFGDTNSSIAGALTAVKLKIPVAHLEAGCREWEMDIPEEINRRLIDHCSNLLLAVSDTGVDNLKKESVSGKIYNLGDPLYEVFKKYFKRSQRLKLRKKLGLKPEDYLLTTLHRPQNVDQKENFANILTSLGSINLPIVFPVHPRTKKQIRKLNLKKLIKPNCQLINPLAYQETLHLLSQAKIVVTDSGGLQKEAFWLKTPCLTIREHTAWVETVDFGVNFLAKPNKRKIKKSLNFIIRNYQKLKQTFLKLPNPYAKKNITKKTITCLKKFAGKGWSC